MLNDRRAGTSAIEISHPGRGINVVFGMHRFFDINAPTKGEWANGVTNAVCA